jgi:hypothetical protein
LQRACDASALAGAAYLTRSAEESTNQAAARKQALLVAKQNNISTTEMTESDITFSANSTKIHVKALRPRGLFFARVFGVLKQNITASATALATPGNAPPVPIAITTVSRNTYQADKLPHVFTLIRPQNTAFATNYIGLPPFDPFTVFDLKGNKAKSPEMMKRQLAGDVGDPVNPQIGDTLTGMASDVDTMARDFKEAIGVRFQKAAGAPWFDTPAITSPAPANWQLVGTKAAEALSGSITPNNPRIVKFVVLDEVNTAVSNYDYPIVSFASAYISSVQDIPGGGLTFTATFLPAGSSDAPTVSLIE